MNKPKDFIVDMENMMDGIKLTINTRIIFGEYSLIKIIEDNGFKHIGIMCDEKLYQNSKHVQKLINEIQMYQVVFLKLYDYPFEPSYQLLDSLMEEIRGKNLELKPWMYESELVVVPQWI